MKWSGTGRRLVCLWSVAACLVTTGVAAAPHRPRVVVVPLTAAPGVPPETAVRLGELLEARLLEEDALEWGALGGLFGQAPGTPEEGPPPDALAALEEGRRLLSRRAFAPARAALSRGLEALLSHPEQPVDFERVAAGLVDLAVACFRQGRPAQGREALRTLARLAPSHALVRKRYPPAFLREVKAARAAVAGAGEGELQVEGPAGARLFVDGREVGPLPARVRLPVGRHFVRAVGPTGHFGAPVEVAGEGTRLSVQLQASASPSPTAGLQVGPVLEQATAARLHRALEEADAHFALVGVLARSPEGHVTAALALYSAADRGFAALPPLHLAQEATEAEASAAVQAAVARVRAFGTPLPLPHALVPTSGGQLVPREEAVPVAAALAPIRPEPTEAPATVRAGLPWWVWAAGGVGVALLGGGLYYGVSQASRPPSGTVAVRW